MWPFFPYHQRISPRDEVFNFNHHLDGDLLEIMIGVTYPVVIRDRDFTVPDGDYACQPLATSEHSVYTNLFTGAMWTEDVVGVQFNDIGLFQMLGYSEREERRMYRVARQQLEKRMRRLPLQDRALSYLRDLCGEGLEVLNFALHQKMQALEDEKEDVGILYSV